MLFIDHFSRMTWVTFLRNKSEAFEKFKLFKAKTENECGQKIKCLHSDTGGEFKNLCEVNGIKRQYCVARTPQQNGIAERKNRTVQEAARTMLLEANLSETFWREAVSTVVYVINRAQLRVNSNKTPYELWNERKATVDYFKNFGSKCYIKIIDDNLGKFHSRADEGIFVGYSTEKRPYKCYNKRLKKIVESIDVTVDEDIVQKLPNYEPKDEERDYLDEDTIIEESEETFQQ